MSDQKYHQIGAEAREDEPALSFGAIFAVMLAGAVAAMALFAAFPAIP